MSPITIRLVASAVLLCGLLLITASSASAAVRYATPTGGLAAGSCGTIATACTFDFGLSGATSGDEVSLLPGTYTGPSVISDVLPGVWLRGTQGARPTIILTQLIAVRPSPDATHRSRISDVNIVGTVSAGLLLNRSTTASRISLSTSATFGVQINGTDVILENSSIRSTSVAGVNLDSSFLGSISATLRGLTVIGATSGINAASGFGSPSPPPFGTCFPGGPVTVNVINSIIIGNTSGISASRGAGCGTSASVVVDHSAFNGSTTSGAAATVTAGPTSLPSAVAADILRDVATDLRQFPNAPTVDAGVGTDVQPADTDLDGIVRTAGGGPDMGAYENTVTASIGAPIASAAGTTTMTVDVPVKTFGTPTAVTLSYKTGSGAAITVMQNGMTTGVTSFPLAGLTAETAYEVFASTVTLDGAFSRKDTGPKATLTTAMIIKPPIQTEPSLCPAGTSVTVTCTPNATGGIRFAGTGASERVVGTSKHDVISGGGGNDFIDGKSGNDTIAGGAGNDKLVGGAGNDRLVGGAGRDVLRGGAGSDACFGGAGNDRCYNGAGNDACSGGAGNDLCDGGSGNDTLFGNAGNDRLLGGPGRDSLFGGPGRDGLFGGLGIEIILRGGPGIDVEHWEPQV